MSERHYYVSVVDGPKVGLLAGPFLEHDAALALVEPARKIAEQLDPWAHFYGFGTLSMPASYATPGKLNAQLGLSEAQ